MHRERARERHKPEVYICLYVYIPVERANGKARERKAYACVEKGVGLEKW